MSKELNEKLNAAIARELQVSILILCIPSEVML
jgi:hypothetical protein